MAVAGGFAATVGVVVTDVACEANADETLVVEEPAVLGDVGAGDDGSEVDDGVFWEEAEDDVVEDALVPAAGDAIFADAVFIDPPPQPARVNATSGRREARPRDDDSGECNEGVIRFMILRRQESRRENHTGASTLLVAKNRLNSIHQCRMVRCDYGDQPGRIKRNSPDANR